MFVGKVEANALGEKPKIFFLPSMSDSHHALDYKFMTAHEIAHATEIPTSHKSLIWREARADILAYLITDKTKMKVPPGMKI